MHGDRSGQVAVIFTSWRSADDADGYAAAATAMEVLAAAQPGYRGIDSARGADGFGITVNWWADEASALAWRKHAEHAAIRTLSPERWYDGYDVAIPTVGRSYRWRRDRMAES